MESVSSLLACGFTPNPIYGKIFNSICSANKDLLQNIVDAASEYDTGVFDNDFPEELIEKLVLKFDKQLDRVIDEFLQTPDEKPVMPPAPSPAVLYARICDDVPVLDVGSGDGRKAEKSKISDLVLSDKVVPVNRGNYCRKWERLDITEDEFPEDRFITSFMSLSQVNDISRVLKVDGMHVVPDLDYLKELGAIRLHDGRWCMGARDKVYNDYEHFYPNKHVLHEGYMGVCTFKERKLFIEFGFVKVKTKPPDLPKVLDAPFNTDPQSTPKYDGIQVFFDLKQDSTGYAVNRAGLARKLQHNFPFSAQFITEYVGGTYVLLRILSYGRVVPWHNFSVLKYFCERVNIDIAGSRLYYPGHTSLAKFKTDGVIMRRNEVDYRVKGHVTVDLDREAFSFFVQYFEKNNIPYDFDEEVIDDVNEYLFKTVNGVYKFEKVRKRFDKNEVTDLGTFLYLADLY